MPSPSISMPYPSSSEVSAIGPPLETSTSSNSEAESPKNLAKRSPSWSTLEEESLIRIYKEEVEGLRKKGGKRPDNVGYYSREIKEKEMKELEVNSSRTPQRVKEKFFNLTCRYKQAKDKIKCSGARSDYVETCPHFDILDEFMGSRDIVKGHVNP